jgi:hypothetical protein
VQHEMGRKQRFFSVLPGLPLHHDFQKRLVLEPGFITPEKQKEIAFENIAGNSLS